MDGNGARTLSTRLEHQAHWRQAQAVRRGDQPATDPDALELEELGEGVRLYRVREQHRQMIDGRPLLVTQRLTKRLVNGWWQTAYEVERTWSPL